MDCGICIFNKIKITEDAEFYKKMEFAIFKFKFVVYIILFIQNLHFQKNKGINKY